MLAILAAGVEGTLGGVLTGFVVEVPSPEVGNSHFQAVVVTCILFVVWEVVEIRLVNDAPRVRWGLGERFTNVKAIPNTTIANPEVNKRERTGKCQ